MGVWLLPPNLLSLARILMTPVIAWKLSQGDAKGAFPWIVAASLSDAFDGLLARRFGWTSDLGRKLDPLADKIMMASVYIALAAGGLAPVWITSLVIGRDLMILGFAGWAARKISLKDFKPSIWGKISTLCQMWYAGAVVLSAVWPGLGLAPLLEVFCWMAAGATVASGAGYVRTGWHMVSRT